MAALGVQNTAGKPLPYAVQERHVLVGSAVVVPGERLAAVGVRTYHRDCSELVRKREYTVIFQQNGGAQRALQGMLLAFLRGNGGQRNVVIFGFVKLTETYSGAHYVYAGAADIFLGNKPLFERRKHVEVCIAAVHVAACLQREGGGLRRGGGYAVGGVEVPDSPAVGGEIAVEAPFLQLPHEERACAGRLAVHEIIRAHHAFNVRVLDQGAERREIGLLDVLRGYLRVECVALRLGAAVYREMLRAGGGFQILPVALEPSYVLLAKLRGEVRVLAVGLVTPAPARVAENIHVGRPEGQTLVDVAVAVPARRIVLRARLRGGYIRALPEHFPVEHRRKAYRLREHRRCTRPGNSVKPLVPPVVGGKSSGRDRRCVVFELLRLLLDCQRVGQCFRALLRGEVRVVVVWHGIPPVIFYSHIS